MAIRLGLAALALIVSASRALGQDETADPNRVPDQIEGVWQTLLLSEVTIAPCPQGFCGTLSTIVVPREGLSEKEYAAALAMPVESYTDVRNPDPTLRNRPMLGLQILTLLPSIRPGVYDGEIYNPEDGRTYSGFVEVAGQDQIRLNGCVLYNLICQGQDWVRVAEEE